MSRVRNLILGGAALSLVLTAIGTFKEQPMEGKTRVEDQLVPYLVCVAAIVVISGIMYALSRWVLADGKKPAGVAAIVCAVVAFLSNAVFWLGLPSVLAAASAGWALDARSRGQSALGVVALIVSALAVAAAVGLAIAG